MFKGWNNGERALAVGLAFAIVILALVAGCMNYNEGYDDAQNAAQQGGIDWMGWLDVAAQWTMAIAAIVLFVWTMKSLRHAEETGRAALDASAESLRAFQRVEQGRLVYERAERDEIQGLPMVWFVNVGRTSVVIRMCRVNTIVYEKGEPIDRIFYRQGVPFSYVVRSDHHFQIGGDGTPPSHPGSLLVGPFKQVQKLKNSQEAFHTIEIIYECMPGQYTLLQQGLSWDISAGIPVHFFQPTPDETHLSSTEANSMIAEWRKGNKDPNAE